MTEGNDHVQLKLLEDRLERGNERLKKIEEAMDQARQRQIQLMAGICVSILLLLVNFVVEKL